MRITNPKIAECYLLSKTDIPTSQLLLIRDVDVAVVTAWNGFFGMFPPLIATLAMGTFSFPSTLNTLLALLIGILSFFGNSLMVLAVQAEDAGTVQLVRKADDILLAFAIQIGYFHNCPDLVGALGAAMIIVSVIVSGVRKLISRHSENECVRTMFCLTKRREYSECQSTAELSEGQMANCVSAVVRK